MTWFFIILVAIAFGNFLMMIRNNRVFEFRKSIIDVIYEASIQDVFEVSQWRYDRYEAVSYERMLWQFWKPLKLESFYQDCDFILPRRALV